MDMYSDSEISTDPLHSGGPRFISRPGGQLYSLRCYVVSPWISRQVTAWYLKTGRASFLHNLSLLHCIRRSNS